MTRRLTKSWGEPVQEVVQAQELRGGLQLHRQARAIVQHFLVHLVLGGVHDAVLFPDGLRYLPVEVLVEELVVEEHTGHVRYPGDPDPVRRAVHGPRLTVQEHQWHFSQIWEGAEESVADAAPEGLDLLALERSVTSAEVVRTLHTHFVDVGDVVEAVALLERLVHALRLLRQRLLREHVKHLRRERGVGSAVEIAKKRVQTDDIGVGIVEKLVYVSAQTPTVLSAESGDEVLLEQDLPGPAITDGPAGRLVRQLCPQYRDIVVLLESLHSAVFGAVVQERYVLRSNVAVVFDERFYVWSTVAHKADDH